MERIGRLAGTCVLVGALVVGCVSTPTLELSSSAFGPNERIPALYTCDGENVSPPLAWDEPPEGTNSFALIVDDPDAQAVAGKIWIHWTIFNIPARARSLAEAIPLEDELPGGARQGATSGGTGYHGPCPPEGRLHHYHFRLYALDTLLPIDAGATETSLADAMRGHVLAEAELVGLYSRP